MSFRLAYGRTHSENGWRNCNRDECILVPGPYMNTAPLRRGVPAALLGEFVRQHHVKVEPIRSSVWAWSRDNLVKSSNHLSATGVDILAPWRPWGSLVLSKDIIDKTYDLLSEFKVDNQHSIKWGREWGGKPDEMHFQLNWREGDPRYSILMGRFGFDNLGSPTVPPKAPVSFYPLLQYGSSGASVTKLQEGLNLNFPGYAATPLVVDGDFGPQTLFAVQEFQGRVGLSTDGKVGPKTWAELAVFGIKP